MSKPTAEEQKREQIQSLYDRILEDAAIDPHSVHVKMGLGLLKIFSEEAYESCVTEIAAFYVG